MSIPSKAERISFWQHSYARAAFVQADEFIKLLLREDPPFNSNPRLALTAGIVVAYGRPFKQRPQVKLSSDVVPAEHKELHNKTIEMRDKVIAHRDLDGPIAEWGFISQLRVVADGTQIEINTLSPNLENEMAHQLLPLLDVLVALLEEKTRPFLNKYLIPPPTSGYYAVSLDDDPAEWLQRLNP